MNTACAAKFPANPDIGGIGVMASFLTISWLTLLTSLLANFPTPKNAPPNSWIRTACNLLGPLSDLQAITGLAILAAGYAQLGTITYYHQELVIMYWWLTMYSFFVARPVVMYVDSTLDPVVVFTRRIVVLVSTVLGIAFQSIITVRERDWRYWPKAPPGRCYRYWDRTWIEEMSWVWVAGASLYALALILVILGQVKVLQALDRWSKKGAEVLRREVQDVYDRAIIGTRTEAWTREYCRGLLYVFICPLYAILYVVYWLITRLLAIWSYGEEQTSFFLLVYTGLYIWETYDIATLKIANRQLVDGDESSMGFGQVLPLVMIMQILFNAIDIWRNKLV